MKADQPSGQAALLLDARIAHLHALQDDVVQRRAAGCAVLPHPRVLQDLVRRRSSFRILPDILTISMTSRRNISSAEQVASDTESGTS